MSSRIQFSLKFDQRLQAYLDKQYPDVVDYRIRSEALDARGANQGRKPMVNYVLDVIKEGEFFDDGEQRFVELGPLKQPPIIVGAGPAGLFCALRLAEYGIKTKIFERGEKASKRMKTIARFWRYGEFNKESNVCFGEGGAGLFSDGKLITRIKSPYISYVMKKLVDFGAPKEIAYQTNPHLGSNKIRVLIQYITDYLSAKGHELLTGAQVRKILFDGEGQAFGVELADGTKHYSSHIILATGHSASDIYQQLEKDGVPMEAKDFSVGVRVEHSRKLIDRLQYGKYAGHEQLDTARYRLSYQDPSSKRGCYSFCMCPGGYVLSSGTDADGLVVNGMSNYRRNSPWSNAAFVVTVRAQNDCAKGQLMAGLRFQKSIEEKAFQLSREKGFGREIPAQRMDDFLGGKSSKDLPKTSCPSGIFSQELAEILPDFVTEHLAQGMEQFNNWLPGFIDRDALLMAPETRTSSPLTILRDPKNLQSPGHRGLYPCGEGAGHAGGITSAAVDGIKVAAQVIATEFNLPPENQ